MGYYSRLFGEWRIDPPLPWGKIKDHVRENEDANPTVKFEVEAQVEDTDDGVMSTMKAAKVVVADDDSRKMYDLGSELLAIAVIAYAAGSTISGYFVREGEEQGDVERYWVEWTHGDGRESDKPCVHSQTAELRWPDGTKAEGY